jgi:hypothetical protein
MGMQRRTLLLFTLFVVTAWFYSSFTADSAKVVAENHGNQVQVLLEAENALSEPSSADSALDQG